MLKEKAVAQNRAKAAAKAKKKRLLNCNTATEINMKPFLLGEAFLLLQNTAAQVKDHYCFKKGGGEVINEIAFLNYK